MQLTGPLPEGYEINPTENDEPLTPDNLRVTAPDGEVLTLEELVLAGIIPE